MFVKYSFENMIATQIVAILFKLGVLALFVVYALMPYGSEFLDLITASLNSGVWDLKESVMPLLKIVGCLILATIVELIFASAILFPIAKRILK